MNQLKNEQSPYLLQHRDNPVSWQPWGEPALKEAQSRDCPILVSIGYSTCHWCHVMARESFEDSDVANYMNEHFVCIKVDREELPAVDHYYMDAVQIFTGRVGWPLNCFATPGGKPFYGGTYFPPEPMGQHISWIDLLKRVVEVYQNRRSQVEDQAEVLHDKIKNEGILNVRNLPGLDAEEQDGSMDWASLMKSLKRQMDDENGGWKGAPKFPTPHSQRFLLTLGRNFARPEFVNYARRTGSSFVEGGLFDPVDGGFARYCMDQHWKVPHFEKMLYDNAGILVFLGDILREEDDDLLRWGLERTLDFLESHMTNDQGLFYTAYDADSEGVEGKYYSWTWEELEECLGTRKLEKLSQFFTISEEGNWEGRNILNSNSALRKAYFENHSWKELVNGLDALKECAEQRIQPALDDKILLDWNAMMVASLFKLARWREDRLPGTLAQRALGALKEIFISDGANCLEDHAYRNGKTYGRSSIDDYAFIIDALVESYLTYFQEADLELAEQLLDEFERRFEMEGNLYHYLPKQEGTRLQFSARVFDHTYPSGNSQMAKNFLFLGKMTGHLDWIRRSRRMWEQMRPLVEKYPTSLLFWANVGFQIEDRNIEISIIGPKALSWGEILGRELRFEIPIVVSNFRSKKWPLLDREVKAENTTIFICEDFTCQRPRTDLRDALEALKNNGYIL